MATAAESFAAYLRRKRAALAAKEKVSISQPEMAKRITELLANPLVVIKPYSYHKWEQDHGRRPLNHALEGEIRRVLGK